MFLFYFTWFFFQNKRWILIVGWYRQKYRYATVRRSHALLRFFFFFFKFRLLLCLKFKRLLRCAYVGYFNLCPESLDTKTGQFASLLGRGWEWMDWKGRGGVFCGISIIFVYLFTYLHIYIFTLLFGERCRSVALYLVVFVVDSVSTNIFLCFFCVCLLYPFGGGPCCIST